jgi:hypothetical protein
MSHKALTTVIDFASAGAILTAFLGYLPPIAALAAIIWYVVQTYESKTVQRWVRLRRWKRARKRRLEKALAPVLSYS